MSLPLKWEFPGGKIEKGETEEEALIREINEEMKCDLTVENKIIAAEYEYDFGIVNLTTYKCTLNNEMPTLTEHKEIKWLEPDELAKLDWAPADIPTVEIIVKGKINGRQTNIKSKSVLKKDLLIKPDK